MRTFYSIEYADDGIGLSIDRLSPFSKTVFDMFYDGTLLTNVHLDDVGKFRLDIWVDEHNNFEIEAKFKWRGWREVPI